MQITYTNIITIGERQIPFAKLDEKEKNQISNRLRKIPLETLGSVSIKSSA